MTKITLVLPNPNCSRTSKQQKEAIADFIEDIINNGPHTDSQLKHLKIPKSWNKKAEGTIQVKNVYTKNCMIFITAEITKKLEERNIMFFVNSFRPIAQMYMMKSAPLNIQHINFGDIGVKQYNGKYRWTEWAWPQGVQE